MRKSVSGMNVIAQEDVRKLRVLPKHECMHACMHTWLECAHAYIGNAHE